MDAFGDNNFEDPAADFLSREKSALAGLENEVLSSNQEGKCMISYYFLIVCCYFLSLFAVWKKWADFYYFIIY